MDSEAVPLPVVPAVLAQISGVSISEEVLDVAARAEQQECWNVGVRGVQVRPLINLDVPVLRVDAGPGTGKTFGLARRVLRLLHPDGKAVNPDRVLICAFNRVIARQLKSDIGYLLDEHKLKHPRIMTIHRLAAELSGEHPRFLLPQEREAAIYDVLLRNEPLRQQYSSYKEADRALREHEAGLREHPGLSSAMSAWLSNFNASLIGELPRQIEAKMRDGEFLGIDFDHIIIDEFQDLTRTEAELLFRLRSKNGQIVVLGDKKQSIYAFRGNQEAGLAAVSQLIEEDIYDHIMTECQRCPGEIVALANDVMAAFGEPLVAQKQSGARIHRVIHDSPNREHTRIAKDIVNLFHERVVRREGVDPSEQSDEKILVLVTRRKWGYELRDAIQQEDHSVPVHTVFSEDILETWPVREAFMFLSLIGSPQDAAIIRDWLSYKEPDELAKNFKAQSRNAAAYANLVETYGFIARDHALELAKLDERDFSGIGRSHLYKRLVRLEKLYSDLPKDSNVDEILDFVLQPERWTAAYQGDQSLAEADLVRLRIECSRIVEELDEEPTIEKIVNRLRGQIARREPIGMDSSEGIEIVTLWGAKGLTADWVYIVGLCDEALPGVNRENSGLTEEEHEFEQLRLLYVSLTRAKQGLVLSRPNKIRKGLVAPLGLAFHQGDIGYYQSLTGVNFFRNVNPANIPNSVRGDDWTGMMT